jgi:3-hydroxyacyl-CoA dehydrogenase
MFRIEKAAVLGAGTMGAQIAAHFANAGVPCLLLDIVPRELTPDEEKKGLTLESKAVRNRIVQACFEATKKAKPAPFFTADAANLISIGNFEDDLAKIKDCDLVIEAVVENLEIKRKIFAEVEKHRKPNSIIASNTSGIPIKSIADGFSEDFRAHFLGVHFFNPPRYMRLVEIIRTEWTKPEVSCFMFGFLDRRLGKGVVPAKDRPNFIANRVGTFGAMATIHAMKEIGFTIEEVDKMTGTAIGHAKSATFRTSDIVGLDVLGHVTTNIHPLIPEDEDRDVFLPPDFVKTMLEKKLLGDKTKGGFYKRIKKEDGSSEILTLDLETFEYRPQQKVKFPSLDAAKNIEDTKERIKTLVWGKDRVGEFLWATMTRIFRYAANRVPEIADTIVEVDKALMWGFAWEIGLFETWDAVGLEKSVARMKEEGQPIPANIQKMLESGAGAFYKEENGQKFYFDFATNEYKEIADQAGVIILKSVKERTNVIKKNAGASLIDLGDGVACVEFHSKMNSIGGDTVSMVKAALDEVEKNFVGLVVGNQGQNFSVGANLMLLLLTVQEEEWDDVDLMIRTFQNSTMSLRYSPKPVVVAPFGMTFGGGCEYTLHADRVRASAETYIGLVEVGVGLIPAGSGTKEMTMRAMNAAKATPDADPFAFIRKTFEMIGMGKVATSAEEARSWGILRKEDSITMNSERLIADAKQEVLNLAASGYVQPQQRTDILALGESAFATLKLGLHSMKRGGFISDHDELIGRKLAKVMTGGDLNHPTYVSEQYLIDLEREAFLSLCGERKTQERIAHTLKTGKPLRN